MQSFDYCWLKKKKNDTDKHEPSKPVGNTMVGLPHQMQKSLQGLLTDLDLVTSGLTAIRHILLLGLRVEIMHLTPFTPCPSLRRPGRANKCLPLNSCVPA